MQDCNCGAQNEGDHRPRNKDCAVYDDDKTELIALPVYWEDELQFLVVIPKGTEENTLKALRDADAQAQQEFGDEYDMDDVKRVLVDASCTIMELSPKVYECD